MRILVLGGTVFLSRAVAAAGRAAGHDVTCLARGVSGTVPTGVRLVRADRSRPDAYDGLAGERFDAVVDVSNDPDHVRAALAALADRAGHWTYVSTLNVYADDATPGQRAATATLREPAPRPQPGDPELDPGDPDVYGARNVSCEQAVRDAMGADAAFLCRPGLIVGPGDTTVRFRYWPVRLARGGEVLAPGDPDRDVQVVDVRDLAEWIVGAAPAGLAGAYDATSAPLPMREFLTSVAAGVGAKADLTWVDQDFLTTRGVGPWAGPRSLPLWLPLPEYGGLMSRDVTASLAAGLRIRPLADTARDTLAWERETAPPPQEGDGGIEPADEAELLAAWQQHRA